MSICIPWNLVRLILPRHDDRVEIVSGFSVPSPSPKKSRMQEEAGEVGVSSLMTKRVFTLVAKGNSSLGARDQKLDSATVPTLFGISEL